MSLHIDENERGREGGRILQFVFVDAPVAGIVAPSDVECNRINFRSILVFRYLSKRQRIIITHMI